MALKPKEIAKLEAASLPPGVIRFVAREAEGMAVLPVLRFFSGWQSHVIIAVLVLAGAFLFGTGSQGWLGAVAVTLPLLALTSLVWLKNRALRHESPAQWSARRIAMHAIGGDPKGILAKHAARLDPALPPRPALAKMAKQNWKKAPAHEPGHGPEARPESPVPATWPRRRLIVAGLVAVPAVIVLAIPVALWILMRSA